MALSAVADEPAAAGGKKIPSFVLADATGARHSQDEWRQAKAVVLYFIDTECPVSNGYAPLMQRIADKYALQGVLFYGVHSEESVTAQSAAAHAKEYGLTFCILLDPKQKLAHPAGVHVTPEAVVLSPTGEILYRGRIDDRYSTEGKRRDDPTVSDLQNALDAVLTGAVPKVQQTRAFGCPLPPRRMGD